MVFIGGKVLLDGFLRKVCFQARGENEAHVCGEGDKALVKGGIVQAGEAEAVADVKACVGVSRPRENVRGDE